MGVAADTYASVSRQQFEDYKTRFFPIENELIASYNNPADRQRLQGEAVSLAQGAFDTSAGVGLRNLSRMGVYKDPAQDRGFGLQRVAATVDARNTTRQHLNDRDELLLTGGLTSRGI